MKYIRFGEIPAGEVSSIYNHGVLVGKEIGVSVYNACKLDGKWHVILPLYITKDTISTYEMFRKYSKTKVYLVKGKEVGIGNDGEPLLKNIKIIKDLTNLYYETSRTT